MSFFLNIDCRLTIFVLDLTSHKSDLNTRIIQDPHHHVALHTYALKQNNYFSMQRMPRCQIRTSSLWANYNREKSSNVEVEKRLTTQKWNSKYFKKQSNNHVQKQYQPRFYEQNLNYQNAYKKTTNLELIMQ